MLQSMGSQRTRHDLVSKQELSIYKHEKIVFNFTS